MQVAADIELSLWRLFGLVTQPKPLPGLRWLALKCPEAAALVVVALHPGDGAIQRLQQVHYPLLKLAGDRFGVVNQIAQDDQLSWLPALAQLLNPLQIGPLTVAGDGLSLIHI